MNNYHHDFFDYPDCPDYWDILDTVIRSGKLTIYSTPTEIKAVVGHEARRYGLSDEEIETAITYAFDNISALNQR